MFNRKYTNFMNYPVVVHLRLRHTMEAWETFLLSLGLHLGFSDPAMPECTSFGQSLLKKFVGLQEKFSTNSKSFFHWS